MLGNVPVLVSNAKQQFEQRERVKLLKEKLAGIKTAEARDLLMVADTLVKKSVWLIGGDGATRDGWMSRMMACECS